MVPDASAVTRAPEVEGVYYVRSTSSSAASARATETWDVGARYVVTRMLGEGSFGAVALARDTKYDGAWTALKRIPNALASEHDARKVLREVVALHRSRHPNVCTLRDAFTRSASSGARKLDVRTMTLKAVSIDVYLSFEYAEGGDVYGMRGQLSAQEVRGLMQQAAEGVRYCHSVGIMHRDIKSANTLLGKHRYGGRVIKLCDFGSARGSFEGVVRGEDDIVDVEGSAKRRRVHSRQSSATAMEQSVLTSNVMTPCYRAPEVIMGGEGYSNAVDVWALGCIFAELLQRQCTMGALNPKLAVQPLFQFDDTALRVPQTGECFGDDACDENAEQRQAQLDKLFNVIGTPTWGEISRIKSSRWREYLQSIPGRAGSLDSRFHIGVDATARDLLKRMLRFDPTTRATCEEILAHEYFKDSKLGVDVSSRRTSSLSDDTLHSVQAMTVDGRDSKAEFWEIDHPGLALDALEKAFARAHAETEHQGGDAWRDAYRVMFEKECSRRERLPDDESNEPDAQDRSLALLFPDFFRGEGAVEYKVDTRNDVDAHLVDEQRGVVHHYDVHSDGGCEEHLNRDRMGEWTNQDWDTSRLDKRKGTPHGVWGVSVLPPGASKEHGAEKTLAGQQSR